MRLFAQAGGSDSSETLRRTMKMLMVTGVAKQLNWKGVCGKPGFSKSKLKTIIFGKCTNNKINKMQLINAFNI